MKKQLFFFTSVLLLFGLSHIVAAADVYAEYQLTGLGTKPLISKIYLKNGEYRSETFTDISGRQLTSTSMFLKSHPGVIINFNSLTKFYTVNKIPSIPAAPDFTIKVIGTEKVGKYNCKHVRMTSKGKSWDAWFAPDLPALNIPVTGTAILGGEKAVALLKSKGITGMLAKIVLTKPGSTSGSIIMVLTKYESKPLSASLFTIPAGYKKSTVSSKNMTPEQRELLQKLKDQKRN